MPRLNDAENPSTLVLSASAGSASRAAAVAGCAMTMLGEVHGAVQRVELSRISPAALYDGLPSDRFDEALGRVNAAKVVVVIAPVEGAAFSALLPAFLDRLPAGTLAGKAVVPLLLGGDPTALARFESGLRRRLENSGAAVALGELFDATDDFGEDGCDARITARVERAVREGLLQRRARCTADVVQSDLMEVTASPIASVPAPLAAAGPGGVVQSIGWPVPVAC